MEAIQTQVPSKASVSIPDPVDNQWRGKIEEAFNNFGALIFPSDKKSFQSTELEDVWNAAISIEREQSNRKSLRNTRRIEPLFQSLKILGNAIGPLCQGVPFLCYLWAPIKLMLVIFDAHLTAYELIIEAYAQIARHLPRFDRLSNAFRDEPEFQGILADVYADILQFHTSVYKIARRGGWRRLFDASWKNFKSSFDGILTNLARSRDLVDREAASFDIVEARSHRRELKDKIEQQAKENRDWHLRETFLWLDLAGRDREQEDLMNKFQSDRHDKTCLWVFEHPRFQTWFDEADPRSVLWLKGKPGSGKTTIASFIAEQAPIPPGSLLVYSLCSELLRRGGQNVLSTLLRLLCAQILRQRPDLLPFAYEQYVKFNKTASIRNVRELLGYILEPLGTTFIILDGLDEYDSNDQTAIVDEFSKLFKDFRKIASSGGLKAPRLKLMISSRETKELLGHIRKRLNNVLTISLSHEAERVSKDIAKYTEAGLQELCGRFEEDELEKIGAVIARKADGMFLWVKLVLSMVEDQWSLAALRAAVHRLPKGLNGVYAEVLRRLQNHPDDMQRLTALRILGYLAFALRPLRSQELCSGLALFEDGSVLTTDTKLEKGVLDICKPLIEERSGGHIAIVHFTARSYLVHESSGPYLSELQMQSAITRLCVRYLQTSFVFLSDMETGHSAMQMIQGLHDLFPYAYTFWVDHASSWIKQQEATSKQEVEPLLSALLETFKRECPIDIPMEDNEKQPIAAQRASFVDFSEPIRRYVAFKYVGNDDISENCKTLDADADPTKLTEAYLRYRATLESLLDRSFPMETLPETISTRDVEEFRARNKEASFLCNWVGCIRSWIGFDSSQLRDDHQTSHQQTWRCREQGCGLIFASKQSLRSHKVKYHLKDTDYRMKRKFKPSRSDNNYQQYSANDTEDLFTADYSMHWYRGSNIDFIRHNATIMALNTTKLELHGILERMTQVLKDELSKSQVEPLPYHFRKATIRNFVAHQEDIWKSNGSGESTNKIMRAKLLIKNVPFHKKLEIEAVTDIDESIAIAVNRIIAGDDPEVGPTDDPEADMSHLWGHIMVS